MACSSCKQVRCVCASGETGPEFIFVEPTGDIACPSTPCESTVCAGEPCAISDCCNFFKGREGDDGDSFLFTAGGPFILGAIPVCSGGYLCPPDDSVSPFQSFQEGGVDILTPVGPDLVSVDPGPLDAVMCPDLPPGTYRSAVRFRLKSAPSGTRVIVLYRPNCDDATEEYVVHDCFAPCPPADSSCVREGSFPFVDIDCTNFLNVWNPNCQPGFRVMTQTGCSTVGATTIRPYVENFQMELVRVTSRDLIHCNGAPLLPGFQKHPACIPVI